MPGADPGRTIKVLEVRRIEIAHNHCAHQKAAQRECLEGAFVRCRPKARRDDWQGSDPKAGLNNKSGASSVTQNFRFAQRVFLSLGYSGYASIRIMRGWHKRFLKTLEAAPSMAGKTN
jgi:hypothetical protein